MSKNSELPENFISWDDSVARVGGEEEFLIELLNDLNGMVKENIKTIKSLIDESNCAEIRELAHSMKGASGNLGLNTIYDICLNLENAAKDEDVENINKYFAKLEKDYIYLEQLVND